MEALVDNLELLANREVDTLLELCGIDEEDLTDMVAEIRSLNPKPALAFEHEVSQPVTPDTLSLVGEVYDPASDEWEAAAPMLRARGGGLAVAVNEAIYAIGGSSYDDFSSTTLVEVYDTRTDSWAERLRSTGHWVGSGTSRTPTVGFYRSPS